MHSFIFIDEVDDENGIKEAFVRIYYSDGEKKGEYIGQKPAKYNPNDKTISIIPSELTSILPEQWQDYKLEFVAIDHAGNEATAYEIAGYGGCGPKENRPQPVAMYKPGHSGSYLGKKGYVAWKQGDTIWSNPYKIMWQIKKENLFPENKFGYQIRGYSIDFEDSEHVYAIIERPFTNILNMSSGGNFRSSTNWGCVGWTDISGSLANGVKPSPTLKTNGKLKLAGEDWKDFKFSSQKYNWLLAKPQKLEQIQLYVEPRNYAQTIRIALESAGTKSCSVAAGKDSCIINADWTPSDFDRHIGWITVRDEDRGIEVRDFYIHVVPNYQEMRIDDLSYDYSERSLFAEVYEPKAHFKSNMYHYPKRGSFKIYKNGEKITEIEGSRGRLSEKTYQFTADLNSLETGFYDVIFETESYQGKLYELAFAEQILIDHNPPNISVNISDGDTVHSIDDINFLIEDEEGMGVYVDFANIQGGPINENINLGTRNQNGKIGLEYPILFPGLVEGEEYTITLGAVDTQRNTAQKSVTFKYDPLQTAIFNGMDGKVWVPAIDYQFKRKDGSDLLQSEVVTLEDGSEIDGTYDVIASLRADAPAPLVVNGVTVYPGDTLTVAGQYDFNANKGRINLPLKAKVEGVTGKAHLLVTTSAPNSPIIIADINLWKPDVNLQSETWEYHQVIDPLNIMAEPAFDTPCRITTDENAAKDSDILRDPVCYLKWTETPDEAEDMEKVLSGLRVAGLVGSAIKLVKQPLAYDLYLYSHGEVPIKIGEGEAAIEVISAYNAIGFEPDLPNMKAMRQIEEVEIGFIQTHGPRCELTKDANQALSVARSSFGTNSRLACYFECVDLPDELDQDKRSNNHEAVRKIEDIDDKRLKWRESALSKHGTRVTLQQGEAEFEMTDPIAPSNSFETSRYSEAHENVFIAPIDATNLGNFVVGSVNAELDIVIRQNGHIISTETVSPSGLWGYQDIQKRLDMPEGVKVWDEINYEIEVSYTDLPSISNTSEIKAIVSPKDSVKPAIESPADVAIDTQALPLTVKIQDAIRFRDPYVQDEMGVWEVRVLSQNASGEDAVITDWQETQSGEAHFDVEVDSIDNRVVRYYAQGRLVSPVEGYERIEVSQRPVFFAVLLGGAIDAEVTARKLSGEAPFNISLRADLEQREMYSSAGDVVWQISSDGGATWDSHTSPDRYKFQYNTILNKGNYLVRAVIENKYSQIISTTETIEVVAYEKPLIEIQSADVVFQGSTETMVARPYLNVFNEQTGEIEQQAYDLDKAIIEWSLNNGRAYTEEGESIELSSNLPERYNIWVRIRAVEAPEDDAAAYTVARKVLEFKPIREPRVRVIGPTTVETDKTYRYSVTTSLPYRNMAGEIKGYFTLPDGTQVDGESVEYTPTERELALGYINMTYTAWVDGYREAGAEGSHTMRSRIWQYTWPRFAIDVRQDANVAPANVILRVRTTNFSGNLEKPVYEWELPSGVQVVEAQNPVSRTIYIPEDGTYEIKVNVSDTRGNESTLSIPLKIEEAEPYEVDLKYSSSPQMLSEPAEILIRPSIKGGHPRDRIESVEWFSNGEPIEGTQTYGRVTLGAGVHELSMVGVSQMGEVLQESLQIEVEENQIPVCKLDARETIGSIRLRADCHDEDGRVRYFEWDIDGEIRINSSRSYSINKRPDEPTPTVTLTAVDDSGGRSEPVTYVPSD